MKNYTKLFLFILILITALYSRSLAYNTYSLFDDTSIKEAQSKTMFKKTFSTLNQALLISEALDDKFYSNFNDVWNKGIKERLTNPKDIQNGIILADLTRVTYSKTGKSCIIAPKNENYASKNTACAVLTIDTNGNKEPNAMSSNQKINDRYTVLLYSDRILTIPNSVEWNLINEYKNKRY